MEEEGQESKQTAFAEPTFLFSIGCGLFQKFVSGLTWPHMLHSESNTQFGVRSITRTNTYCVFLSFPHASVQVCSQSCQCVT